MPRKRRGKEIADLHEDDVANTLDGRTSRGSGTQSKDPMDGRHDSYREDPAFAWECKATQGKGLRITREMWEKACEQAHRETPMLAVRFADEYGYPDTDLAVIELAELADLRARLLVAERRLRALL